MNQQVRPNTCQIASMGRSHEAKQLFVTCFCLIEAEPSPPAPDAAGQRPLRDNEAPENAQAEQPEEPELNPNDLAVPMEDDVLPAAPAGAEPEGPRLGPDEIDDDTVLADLRDSGAGRMAPRAPAPRQHRSPAEILEQISPPGIVLRLSFNDHRFKAETATFLHVHLRSLASPFSQKSYSKSFGSGVGLSWKDALVDVHSHAWQKYQRLKDKGHIEEHVEFQRAVEPAILDLLEPEILKMPPPTRYDKRK